MLVNLEKQLTGGNLTFLQNNFEGEKTKDGGFYMKLTISDGVAIKFHKDETATTFVEGQPTEFDNYNSAVASLSKKEEKDTTWMCVFCGHTNKGEWNNSTCGSCGYD